MGTGGKIGALLAGLLLAADAAAVPTRLPAASWLPPAEDLAAAAGQLALYPESRLFLESLSTAGTRKKTAAFAARLDAAVPTEQSEALQAIKEFLIREGFDPFSIIAEAPVRKSDPRLRQNLCVRYEAEGTAKVPALLITSAVRPKHMQNAAVALTTLELMREYRLPLKKPVWVCLYNPQDDSIPTGRTRELYRKSHAKSPSRFSGVTELSAVGPSAYLNFLGATQTRLQYTEQRLRWRDMTTDTVFNAARAGHTALAGMKTRWMLDKKTPYSHVQLSPVVCQKSFFSRRRSTCSFTVSALSRDRSALTDIEEQALASAQRTVKSFNEKLSDKAYAVRLSFPQNTSVSPAAGSVQNNALVRAWSAALEASGMKTGRSYVSTRFIASEAVFALQAKIPALVFSAVDEKEQITEKSLPFLAYFLTLMTGMTSEEGVVSPAANGPVTAPEPGPQEAGGDFENNADVRSIGPDSLARGMPNENSPGAGVKPDGESD